MWRGQARGGVADGRFLQVSVIIVEGASSDL